MPVLKDISGQRFGRLVPFSRVGGKWECRCDCGRTTFVKSYDLTRGASRSCGCLVVEHISALNRTHGRTGSRTYQAWANMIQRCENPKNRSLVTYGARGISICPAWRSDFAAFLADMGECPDGLTLERNDSNGNYEPGNCRWIPREEQSANRGYTIRVCGRTIKQIAADAGLRPHTTYMRYRRNRESFTNAVRSLYGYESSTPE